MDATETSILDFAIENLDLGVRAYNVLKRVGVNTLRDLSELSVEKLNAWCQEPGHERVALGPAAFVQVAEAQDWVLQNFCRGG